MSCARLLSSLTRVLARPPLPITAASRKAGTRLAYLSTNRTTAKPDADDDHHQQQQQQQQQQEKAETGSAVDETVAQDQAAGGEPQSEFEAASSPSVAQMADLIAEKDVKLAELTDKYRRALAEMENVRTRSRRDVDNAYKYSVQGFAKDLLEVADNLNRALDNIDRTKLDANADLRTLYEGLQMTETGLGKILAKYGVEKMELSPGAVFDPNFHSAIFQRESAEASPGTIASIVSTGYMFKDRVLRPAAVGTFKSASTTTTKSQPDQAD